MTNKYLEKIAVNISFKHALASARASGLNPNTISDVQQISMRGRPSLKTRIIGGAIGGAGIAAVTGFGINKFRNKLNKSRD